MNIYTCNVRTWRQRPWWWIEMPCLSIQSCFSSDVDIEFVILFVSAIWKMAIFAGLTHWNFLEKLELALFSLYLYIIIWWYFWCVMHAVYIYYICRKFPSSRRQHTRDEKRIDEWNSCTNTHTHMHMYIERRLCLCAT